MAPPLIEMRGIERTYVMGDNLVHALRGVDLTIEHGRVDRDHGHVGLGQVDDDEHHGLPRSAHDVAPTSSTARTSSRLSRTRARRCPRPDDRLRVPELQPAVAYQRSRERRDAADVPGRLRRGTPPARDEGARARRPLGARATTTRASSRAASSSASRSRARSSGGADHHGRRADRQPRHARPRTRSWRSFRGWSIRASRSCSSPTSTISRRTRGA